MKRIFYLTFIIGYLTSQILSAQEHFVSAADSSAIDQQLDSHFGVDYEITDYIFVDSLEEHYDIDRELIDDGYGTLDNCIVFTAEKTQTYKNVKGIVGVYKNGQIIWYSDYIIPDNEIYGNGFIYSIEDINNDGKVEIMTEWEAEGGMRYRNKVLYVHSWNGNQGILAVDASQGYSPIDRPDTGIFKIIDVQGDGIFEIVSIGFENLTTVYEWNGNNYVFSETAQIDSVEMFFPRNNFTPIVTCVVTKSDKNYTYEYTVKNLESSAQSINEFDVYGHDISYKIEENYYSNVNKPNEDWYGDDRKNSVTWDGPIIRPGKILKGFSYSAKGLPEIGEAYLRGYNYQWSGDYRENTSVKDYLNNSVIVKTIAAKLPPEPFIHVGFIDTLKTYTDSSNALGWITDEQTKDKYNAYFSNAKTYLEQGDSSAARTELEKVLTDCNTDSSTVLTSEAYALLYFNTEYLVNKLPEEQQVEGLPVKLQDSQGNLLQGGSLQYYEGGWKDAINNGNGIFIVQTDRSTISLKMNYLGGWQQFNNVTVGTDTVTFQTVNTTISINNSQGSPMDGAVASFYAKSWQEIGTTVNGKTSIELLPKEYSFRISYLGGNIDKKQNIGEDSLVLFQTVNTVIRLKDSQGNLLDGGTAQFYARSWQEIGTTVNGEVTKELLPRNYSFRITYENISNDKQQNIGDNPVVEFSSILVTVSVKDGNGSPILNAEVQYYSKKWNIIGNTDSNGEITTEMLPKNITFRVKYNSKTYNKQQNTAENNLVEFIVE